MLPICLPPFTRPSHPPRHSPLIRTPSLPPSHPIPSPPSPHLPQALNKVLPRYSGGLWISTSPVLAKYPSGTGEVFLPRAPCVPCTISRMRCGARTRNDGAHPDSVLTHTFRPTTCNDSLRSRHLAKVLAVYSGNGTRLHSTPTTGRVKWFCRSSSFTVGCQWVCSGEGVTVQRAGSLLRFREVGR